MLAHSSRGPWFAALLFACGGGDGRQNEVDPCAQLEQCCTVVDEDAGNCVFLRLDDPSECESALDAISENLDAFGQGTPDVCRPTGFMGNGERGPSPSGACDEFAACCKAVLGASSEGCDLVTESRDDSCLMALTALRQSFQLNGQPVPSECR